MLVCNGAPQNIYGLGPRKAIIRPWVCPLLHSVTCSLLRLHHDTRLQKISFFGKKVQNQKMRGLKFDSKRKHHKHVYISLCESICFKCAETHQYECFLSKPYEFTFFVHFVHWVRERIWDSHRLSPVDLAVVLLFRPPKNCLTDSVCRKIMRCNIWRKSLFLNGRSRTHKFWPDFNHFVVQSSLKRAFLQTV